jgi:hypothetical protein
MYGRGSLLTFGKMNEIYIFIFVGVMVLCLALGIASQWWITKTYPKALDTWAAHSNIVILEKDRPVWDQGPFTARSTQWQRVYRLKIQSIEKKEEIIWARVGSPWFYAYKPQITLEKA